MGHQLKLLLICSAVLVQTSVGLSFNDVLANPVEEKCRNRPREFEMNGRNFFYSDNHPETKGQMVSWLDARNICRQYCMDSISIETQKEFNMVKKVLEDFLVGYLWTSGRVCDVPECGSRLNQWYWTHNNKKLPSAGKKPVGWSMNPWSQTGFKQQSQPDNAEFDVNGKNESCLAVLHNVYDDGIKFHDVACYHKKAFICEDSDELLKLVNII